MAKHEIIVQGGDSAMFTVLGETEPFSVKATPIVTAYYMGVTVGFFVQTQSVFAHWKSPQLCDVITGWRVIQLLPRVVQLRTQGYGRDTTLGGLVLAMGGNGNEGLMRACAQDLNISTEELSAELQRLKGLWPTAEQLRSMWDRLPEKEQDKLAPILRKAMTECQVAETSDLIDRIELAELRLRKVAEQMRHEDELIEAGLPPECSLRQLMWDIGVTNLANTLNLGDPFEGTHFRMDDLDHQIMRELIGTHAYQSSVLLVTTAKEPDDPSALHVAGGNGVTVFGYNFGSEGHPLIKLGGEPRELVYVRWDRVTEHFVLTVRPQGLSPSDDSRDVGISIPELRARIGADTGLTGPLPAGTRPAWPKGPDVTVSTRRR